MIGELIIVALAGVGGAAVGAFATLWAVNKQIAASMKELQKEHQHLRDMDRAEKLAEVRAPIYLELRETLATWNRKSSVLAGMTAMLGSGNDAVVASALKNIQDTWDVTTPLADKFVDLRAQIADPVLHGLVDEVLEVQVEQNASWGEIGELVGGLSVTDPRLPEVTPKVVEITKRIQEATAPVQLKFNQRIEELMSGTENVDAPVAKTQA